MKHSPENKFLKLFDKNYDIRLEYKTLALAGVAQWVECQPVN